MCAGIVGCSYIFQLNRSINSKWLLSDCATIAFGERYLVRKPKGMGHVGDMPLDGTKDIWDGF